MTLKGTMAVTLRYFTEFGKHVFQLIDLWQNFNAQVYCIL